MVMSVIGAVSHTPYDPGAVHKTDFDESMDANIIVFEGSTVDACETSFKSADPVCDANIILPAPATIGSYYPVLSTLANNRPDIANGIWFGTSQIIAEGSTADACEIILAFTNPTTGDKTITFPASTGTVLLTGRTTQQFIQSIAYAKLGASGAGWVIGAADSTSLATLPASQTDENMVIPITVPLKVGTIITGFTINGQIESAGNTATLDASLRKMTAVDSDFTDAAVGAFTTLTKTADYKVVDGNSLLNETVAADESFYILVEGTTAASTDIAIGGVTITVTEP